MVCGVDGMSGRRGNIRIGAIVVPMPAITAFMPMTGTSTTIRSTTVPPPIRITHAGIVIGPSAFFH